MDRKKKGGKGREGWGSPYLLYFYSSEDGKRIWGGREKGREKGRKSYLIFLYYSLKEKGRKWGGKDKKKEKEGALLILLSTHFWL